MKMLLGGEELREFVIWNESSQNEDNYREWNCYFL